MIDTIRCTWMIGLMLMAALGGCAPVGPGGASDVPCLEPDAWAPEKRGQILTRPETEGSDVLLLAHQTSAQRREDREDSVIGNGPHGPVYRFDPSIESFELVDDEVWADSDGVVVIGAGGSRPSPFSSSRGLHFQDRPVPIQGRSLLFVQPAPFSPAVAVLTAEGPRSISFPIFPGGATGQHYHQLFSEIDGEPLGQAVRVPLITRDTYFKVCWTRDERYVIYSQHGPEANGYDFLCVVDVADEMALLEDDQSP